MLYLKPLANRTKNLSDLPPARLVLHFLRRDPAELDELELAMKTVPCGVVAGFGPFLDVGFRNALEDCFAKCLGLDDGAVVGVEDLAVGPDAEGVGPHREAGTETSE